MRLWAGIGALMTLSLGLSAPAPAGGLSLEQVIREVCAKSDSVKSMKETIVKSEEVVRENYSRAYPTVSATVFGGRTYGSLGSSSASGTGSGGFSGSSGSAGAGSASGLAKTAASPLDLGDSIVMQEVQGIFSGLMAPREQNVYSASARITQPIYTFGKVGTAVHVAKQYLNSAKSFYARNLQQLQLMALDAYYGAVLAEIQADIQQRSLARKSELSQYLERNFKLGAGSKAQILATRADLMSQVPAILKAQQDLLGARMRLNMLMGRQLTDSLQLDTGAALPGALSLPIPAGQEATKAALDRREDLRSLEFYAEANRGGAKIYDAMYLPSIAATGSLGTGGTEPRDLGDWDKRNWMLGLGLQWTFFDGFANNAKARQYRSDARKLELTRSEVSKVIEIEVATALIECAGADSNLSAMQEMLAAARESYDLTNDNFKQGSGQFADLQLAEERLRQAEMGSVSARYRFVRSRAALLVAMGEDIVNVEGK